MAFPNTRHADQVAAANDLLNQATNQGYTTINTNLGERGLKTSVLANLLYDLNASLSLTIGSTTPITGVRVFNATLTPATVTAATVKTGEVLFTGGGITNLSTGDVVFVSKPTSQALLGVVNARVAGGTAGAGNGTIGITYWYGIGTITPAAEAYRVVALRS